MEWVPDINSIIIEIFLKTWIAMALFLSYLLTQFFVKISKWPIDNLFFEMVIEPFVSTIKSVYELIKKKDGSK